MLQVAHFFIFDVACHYCGANKKQAKNKRKAFVALTSSMTLVTTDSGRVCFGNAAVSTCLLMIVRVQMVATLMTMMIIIATVVFISFFLRVRITTFTIAVGAVITTAVAAASTIRFVGATVVLNVVVRHFLLTKL